MLEKRMTYDVSWSEIMDFEHKVGNLRAVAVAVAFPVG